MINFLIYLYILIKIFNNKAIILFILTKKLFQCINFYYIFILLDLSKLIKYIFILLDLDKLIKYIFILLDKLTKLAR